MEAQHGAIRTSDTLGKMAEALSKAQAEFPAIEKDKTAKVRGKTKEGKVYDYTYKYADIADVLAAVRPILGRHGLAFIQPTIIEGGTIFVRSRLVHSSGEWIESEYPVASYAEKDHQKIGAALTYARRYSGCAILGVAAEEDVDAGDAAADAGSSKPAARQSRPREAPEVVSSAGNGKGLPPVVGEDHSPPESTIATETPHEIGTKQKDGKIDWNDWGSWLTTALKNAKDGKARAGWMEANEHLLRECEEQSSDVHGRIMEALDALNNPPSDLLDPAGREA
jgi:hypothetical protein